MMLHRRFENWRARSAQPKTESRNGTRSSGTLRRVARRVLRALLLVFLVIALVALVTLVFTSEVWPLLWTSDLEPSEEHVRRKQQREEIRRNYEAALAAADPNASHFIAVPPMPFIQHQQPLNKQQAGQTWFDASGNVHTASSDGLVEFVTPRIVLRDRTTNAYGSDYRAWPSSFMPGEPFTMPDFASPAERNTLYHASIFISLAAFRDHDCHNTVRNALELAGSAHRVYFGISEEREAEDPSCLSEIEQKSPEVLRRLLWGRGAPAQLKPIHRKLSWNDILASRGPIVTKDEHLTARVKDGVAVLTTNETSLTQDVKAGREPAVPEVIYLDEKYQSETLECLAGQFETQRDHFLLSQRDFYEKKDNSSTNDNTADGGQRFYADYFRHGKGGPQTATPDALAGCRAVVRVTPPTQARGPTYARYIVSLFYFNQDYFMMIDSHSRFSVGWDLKMIRRVFQTPTRGVLSHYPNGFTLQNEREDFDKRITMTMCKGVYVNSDIPKLGSAWALNHPAPELEAFAAAGYLFGDAQMLLDVPFDPLLHYVFEGEEPLYSARLWTSGWDIYWPAEANIFHNYNRRGVSRYWSYMNGAAHSNLGKASSRMTYIMRVVRPLATYSKSALALLEQKAKAMASSAAHDNDNMIKARLGVHQDVAAAHSVSPQDRLVTTEEHIVKSWPAGAVAMYYGLGHNRSIEEYWDFAQMTDKFVVTKDNEGRWAGGTGLCDKYTEELKEYTRNKKANEA